jgi:hypothetical protein
MSKSGTKPKKRLGDILVKNMGDLLTDLRKAKPKKKRKYPVVRQAWKSMDRWSGPESAGDSLHLTRADRDKFVRKYLAKNNPPLKPGQSVPEYYTTVDGDPDIVDVNESVYRLVMRSNGGIWATGVKKS